MKRISNNILAGFVLILMFFTLISTTLISYFSEEVRYIEPTSKASGNVKLTVTAICGNLVCNSGECNTCASDCSILDCCGDGTCQSGLSDGDETTTNCAIDCVAPVVSAPGGGGAGGEREKNAILVIIVPPDSSIYLNDTIILPVLLRNAGGVILNRISLSTIANIEGVSISLRDTYFDSLDIGEPASTALTVITQNINQSSFQVEIFGYVEDPELVEKVTINFNILQRGLAYKDLRIKLEFAEDLLKENPECLELNELIEQARRSFELGEIGKAEVLIDGAVRTCENLISTLGREIKVPKERPISLPILITVIFIILLILILLAIYLIIKIRQRRRKEFYKKR